MACLHALPRSSKVPGPRAVVTAVVTAGLLAACAGMGGRTVSESRNGAPSSTAPGGVLWPTPADTRRAGWPDPASRQLVVVMTPGWNAPNARLARFERDPGGTWRPVGSSVEVGLGRAGSAWGLGLHPPQANGPLKQEGDGRSAAGVFAIGPAFGHAAAGNTRLPWLALRPAHWCIDVPGSPFYNRIVDANLVGEAAVAGSTLPMHTDRRGQAASRHALGLVIAHNVEGAEREGSCVFIHVRESSGPPTGSGVAMAETALAALLAWIDPAKTPRLMLLPVQEYARLQAPWDLPAPTLPPAHPDKASAPAAAAVSERRLGVNTPM